MTHASNFISIAVILGALAVLLVGLKAVEKKKRFHPEILRKGVHVGMGLVVLPLPWMLDGAWPMIILGGLACATLVATRLIPSLRGGIGTVLGGVDREGLGEIYFAISVTILFLISQGEWLLYVVPILTLALADAAAAVIGIRYGQTQYQTSEGIKSVEGSLAFFLVTFFSAHLPLLLLTDTGRVEVVLIATILALLVMMLELVSWRGLDNLFIPLGTYAFLRLYLDEDPQALLIRVLVAIAFVTFTLAWRHRSKLDDSALVGCALFGYGAFLLGGWQWLIAPFGFFAIHTLVWPRSGKRRSHTVYTMLSIAGGALLWLFVHVIAEQGWFVIPFATTFAAQLTLYGVSRVTLQPERGNRLVRLMGAVGLGWIIVYVPTLLIVFGRGIDLGNLMVPDSEAMGLLVDLGFGLLAIGIVAAVFLLLTPRIYGPPLRANLINPIFAILGLFASLVASLRWLT
ncbi:MAG: hypothetical protein OXI44_00300 [Bacteroidota bacterium]|nr:hypothetical protein [Bacteroidota bacterium]